jgi:hypothetical protein
VRLLRGVDQKKKESKSTPRDGALRDAQIVNFAQQVVERSGPRFTAPPRARCDTEPLDDIESRFSLEAMNYAAKCSSEPANIVVEGDIFFAGRARSRYLRRHAVSGLLA